MKVDIALLQPNESNPRFIKDDKFEKLCQSIRDLPQMLSLRPIVVDEDYTVLGGNMRLRALLHLGHKEVEITVAEGLTEEQKREFVIKDNSGFGEWDWDQLANEWSDLPLNDWGIDLPEDWLKEPLPAVDDDFTPPDTIETDIVLGDLFEIGPHRLLCGDSTNADDVKRVVGEGKPILMVTDPPYGVEYDANWRNEADRANGKAYGARAVSKVENDDRIDWTDAYSLFTGSVAYVWHADRHAKDVCQNLEDCDFKIVSQIIWAKSNFAISRGDYHWKHEPCWYAVKKGNTHNWQGDRSQTTLWEIDKPMKSETGHSTQKPIDCMAKPIENNSSVGQGVYDPFLGSGTTMVAAHQLKRICYGLELKPEHCQMIVNRMRLLDPAIEIKRNGVLLTESELQEITGEKQANNANSQ